MVTYPFSLTRLENLLLNFLSLRSYPDRSFQRPSSLTWVDAPALTYLEFKGVNEYIEDSVARINTPRLFCIKITFFNQLLFDFSQLVQFVGHRKDFKGSREASVDISRSGTCFAFPSFVVGCVPNPDWDV